MFNPLDYDNNNKYIWVENEDTRFITHSSPSTYKINYSGYVKKYDGDGDDDGDDTEIINKFKITWDIKYLNKLHETYFINALCNVEGQPKKMIEWIVQPDPDKSLIGSIRYLQEYVAEIYEFKINNYTNDKNVKHIGDFENYSFTFNKFNKIKTKCGIINAIAENNDKMKDYDDPDNIDYKGSCDNIDDTGFSNTDEYEDLYIILDQNEKIKQLYDMVYSKNSKLNLSEFDTENDDLSKIKDEKDDLCNDVENIIKELIEKYKLLLGDGTYNNDNSYVHKVNFDNEEKIIVIGDIHGSFHTFFRLFIRLCYLEIINIENFKIKDEYVIIFLGDILDRGAFQLETLYLVYSLLNSNIDIDNDHLRKPKIIYNRGNHETKLMSYPDDKYTDEEKYKISFKNEIKIKCKINIAEINLELLNYFPVAVIVNNLYWLCHGGIPDLKGNKKVCDIQSFDYFKTYSQIIVPVNKVVATKIMWNDFWGEKDNSTDINRGKRNARIVGTDTINDFLNSGFKFIIRGHTDNLSNTWLLTNQYDNNTDFSGIELIDGCYHIANDINRSIHNFIKYNISSINNRYYALLNLDLPENKIEIDHNKIIYPVLTISTNTAFGRMLNRDSFIILRPKN